MTSMGTNLPRSGSGFAMTLTLWLIVGGLMLSGISLLAYGYKHRGEQIVELKAERDGWKDLAESRAKTVSALTNANEANVANVRTLSARLSEAIGQAQAADEAAAQAIARQRQAERAAQIAMDTLRHDRERAYAQDESCRAWADQPVCGAVSGGLLKQWSGQGRGGDGGGAGAGGSAAVRPAAPGPG
jgi:hypothetical protein